MDDADGKETNNEVQVCKRLRCTDPDLTVLVKYLNEEENVAQKEYYMYSHVLAGLSNFIDTALSVDMKEKATCKIVFPDVTPEIFEMALKILLDPVASRSLKAKDAIQLIKFYDQYEFAGGVQLCDDVFANYFQQKLAAYRDSLSSPEETDFFVEALVLVFQFKLRKAMNDGRKCIQGRMELNLSRHGRFMFTTEHIEKLQPAIRKGLFGSTWSMDFNGLFPEGLSLEDLSSSLFPKYYVTWASAVISGCACPLVEVSGTGNDIDGVYERENTKYRGHRYRKVGAPTEYSGAFVIDRNELSEGGWAIMEEDTGGNPIKFFWVCPNSASLEVPPEEGPWVISCEAGYAYKSKIPRIRLLGPQERR
ncbi:expressed unknown protein [Seminavis robusta]|uniref:BTB domain-containing protein n=1 Tax=Seminavis robusta TaxID=568900 RepID=A0A9N8EP39_9STRA|nr:expressed unknown protein [Seminavis robusta]|eukprot:Sro1268_g257800.1 n/a (364) ;mRNA; r:22648-23739